MKTISRIGRADILDHCAQTTRIPTLTTSHIVLPPSTHHNIPDIIFPYIGRALSPHYTQLATAPIALYPNSPYQSRKALQISASPSFTQHMVRTPIPSLRTEINLSASFINIPRRPLPETLLYIILHAARSAKSPLKYY